MVVLNKQLWAMSLLSLGSNVGAQIRPFTAPGPIERPAQSQPAPAEPAPADPAPAPEPEPGVNRADNSAMGGFTELQYFRMYTRFGFEDGQMGDPAGEPTEDDVKGMLCTTNEFMTQALADYTKEAELKIYTVDVSYGKEAYMYEGSEPEAPRNVPIMVNYTMVVYMPGMVDFAYNDQELWEATKYFDYFKYIQEYLWKLPEGNFFKDARGFWYTPEVVSEDPASGAAFHENSMCPANW